MNETNWSDVHERIDGYLGPLKATGLAGEAIVAQYSVKDGRPRITSVSVEAPEGGEVSPETLRSLSRNLYPWLERFISTVIAGPLGVGPDDVAGKYQRERRRRSWGDDDLRRVADVFRNGGDRPREAVMDQFHVSESTAARLLRMARAKGFLEDSAKSARRKK